MKKTRMQIYPGRYRNSIRFGLISAQTRPWARLLNRMLQNLFQKSVIEFLSHVLRNILSSFFKPNDSCCLNIVKTEGLAAVMKGVRAPVYAQTFNNAILFGTERFCDRNINIEVTRWTI